MDKNISEDLKNRAFEILLNDPKYKYCADCGHSYPEWYSLGFGVLICFKCSGGHRSLGANLTRVKSTKLDYWTLNEMYLLKNVNNEENNKYWEAIEPEKRPTSTSTLDEVYAFIREKYVKRSFADKNETKTPAEKYREELSSYIKSKNLHHPNVIFEVMLQEFQSQIFPKDEALPTRISSRTVTMVGEFNRARHLPAFKLVNPSTKPPTNEPVQDNDDDLDLSPRMKENLINNGGMKSDPDKTLKTPTKIPLRKSDSAVFDNVATPLGRSSNKKVTNLFEGLNIKKVKPAQGAKSISWDNYKINLPGKRSVSVRSIPDLREDEKSDHKKLVSNSAERPAFNRLSLRKGSASPFHNTSISKDSLKLNKFAQKYVSEETHKVTPERRVDSEESLSVHDTDTSPILKDKRRRKKKPMETFEIEEPIIPSYENATKTKLDSDEVQDLKLFDALKKKYGKHLLLVGCFIIHMAQGFLYSWGSISPYVASYIQKEDPAYGKSEHYHHMFLFMFLGFSFGWYYTEEFANRYGLWQAEIIGFGGLGLSLIFSSFLYINEVTYALFLGFIPGLMIGLTYSIPYVVVLQHFVNAKDRIKGYFYLANGFGAFLLNFYSSSYLNPNNEDIMQFYEYANEEKVIYYPNAGDHVDTFLEVSALIMIVVGFVGGMSMNPILNFVERDYKKLKQQKEKKLLSYNDRASLGQFGALFNSEPIDCPSIAEAKASKPFRNLFLITLCSSILSSYLLYSYKTLGMRIEMSDKFISIMGGIGIVLRGLGGKLGQRYYSKDRFTSYLEQSLAVEAGAAVLGALISYYRLGFLIVFFVVMTVDGFISSCVSEEVYNMFGKKVDCQVMAYINGAYCLAILSSFLFLWLLESLGPELILMFLAAPMLVAFGISQHYTRRVSWIMTY